jgi:hypothetical protein
MSHAASHRPAQNTDAAQLSARSSLLHFLILLAIICGVTCLYVWQANTISAIRVETQAMTEETRALERQNVSLMLEYARWDAPGYIEAESSRSGMLVGQAPIRVRLPAPSERQDAMGPDAEKSAAIGQLATWLPGSLTISSHSK